MTGAYLGAVGIAFGSQSVSLLSTSLVPGTNSSVTYISKI